MWRTAYDNDGVIIGHYPDDYAGEIPAQALTLTDEQHAQLCGHEHEYRVINGSLQSYTPPLPTLDNVKAAKTAELWAAGDELLRAIDGRIVSQSDRENAAAHQQGIADIEAGRDTPFAAAVKLAAEQAGRAVEDLIAAHKRHMVAGVFLRSLISGEQNRVTALLTATQTVEEAEAVQWTMTAEQAMSTVQAKLQALAQ